MLYYNFVITMKPEINTVFVNINGILQTLTNQLEMLMTGHIKNHLLACLSLVKDKDTHHLMP